MNNTSLLLISISLLAVIISLLLPTSYMESDDQSEFSRCIDNCEDAFGVIEIANEVDNRFKATEMCIKVNCIPLTGDRW